MPRIPFVCQLLAWGLLASAPAFSVASAQMLAALKDGTTVAGRLTGTADRGLAFETETGKLPDQVVTFRQILLPTAPRRRSSQAPLRRLHLAGGERLSGEFQLDKLRGTLRRHGFESAAIPRELIDGLYGTAGEVIAVYEDFEQPRNQVRAKSGALSLDNRKARSGNHSLRIDPGTPGCLLVPQIETLREGRLELSFFDDGQSADAEWGVQLEFGTGNARSTITFLLGWREMHYWCHASQASEVSSADLERKPGWHDLTVSFDERRITALIDDRWLARGPAPESPLALITIEPRTGSGKPREPATSPQAFIDDIKLWQTVDRLPVPERSSDQGSVWLAAGDELFCEILAADAQAVSTTGRFGDRNLPWSSLRGLTFPPSKAPAAPPIHGLVCVLEFAPRLYAGDESADRLVAAIQSADERGLVAQHPWLGRFELAWEELSRLVPLCSGTYQLIEPAVHHLGDSIREDFSRKIAEGPRWERRFMHEGPLPRRAWVSLLAADLEPGTPEAAKSGKFSDDLQAGYLRTTLIVNGRRIDDLNRHVSLRAHPGNPQRLRIGLPAGTLKAGENTIRLEQRSLRTDSEEFDDFEFSRVALEYEP